MANTKELKDRIQAVQQTRKITSAMYLISSTKLRRAKADLARTRPYFDALREEIGRIFRVDGSFESRYFLSPDGALPKEGSRGILAVTADKGLAGAYNMNVIRQAETLCREAPDAKLFVIGEVGRRYFANHDAPLDRSFRYGAQSPTMERARQLRDELLQRYDSGALNELLIVYTDMKNSLSSVTLTQRLLPLSRGEAAQTKEPAPEYVPSLDAVVRGIVRSYLSGYLFSALLDSFCSEQNARSTAMDSANMNAQQLLGDLSLQLNRQRQAAITQEITEISAGAQAQKGKRAKKV